MNALSAICRRRCGFDPADLSPDQLRSRLPDVMAALEAELDQSLLTVELVQKSAVLRAGSIIPNPGIVRDEQIQIGKSQPDDFDPNQCFDSILPSF